MIKYCDLHDIIPPNLAVECHRLHILIIIIKLLVNMIRNGIIAQTNVSEIFQKMQTLHLNVCCFV